MSGECHLIKWMNFKRFGVLQLTLFIIQSGALGSFMLHSFDKPEKVLTIAKWRSRQDWELFWENSNPEKMQKMREIAERISVESFDEIEDRSK